MSAIQKFMSRYDAAQKGQSKEVRFLIHEAKDLAHELSMYALDKEELQKEVILLQRKLIQALQERSVGPTEINVDGGAF